MSFKHFIWCLVVVTVMLADKRQRNEHFYVRHLTRHCHSPYPVCFPKLILWRKDCYSKFTGSGPKASEAVPSSFDALSMRRHVVKLRFNWRPFWILAHVFSLIFHLYIESWPTKRWRTKVVNSKKPRTGQVNEKLKLPSNLGEWRALLWKSHKSLCFQLENNPRNHDGSEDVSKTAPIYWVNIKKSK